MEVILPIEGSDRVQFSDDVIECVRLNSRRTAFAAEEPAAKIVERAAAAGQLADAGVDVEPDKHAFIVIINAALAGLPSPVAEECVRGGDGSVEQRPPGTAAIVLHLIRCKRDIVSGFFRS